MLDLRTLLQQIASHYGVRIKQNGSIDIPCPAHNGEDSNCNITVGDRLLVGTCFSHQCNSGDIIKAAFESANINPDVNKPTPVPASKPKWKHIASYRKYGTSNFKKVYRMDVPASHKCEVLVSRKPCKKKGVHKHFRQVPADQDTEDYELLLWGENKEDTSATIVICEGEKAAKAMAEHADIAGAPYVAASWMGGTGRVDKANYSLVKDRNVVLWPDQNTDQNQGVKAMRLVERECRQAGAAAVLWVDISSMPNKTDAYDVNPRQAVQMVKEAREAEPEKRERDTCDVTDLNLRQRVDAYSKLLLKHNNKQKPRWFIRHGVMLEVASNIQESRPVTGVMVKARIEDIVDVVEMKFDDKGASKRVAHRITTDEHALFLDREPVGFPRVKALKNTPYLAKFDDTYVLVDKPGYNSRSQLYLHPHHKKLPSYNSEDALATLWALLGEFPYADPTQDWAHTLAALLTALIRPACPIVPLVAITKPEPGTGATLLMETMLSIVYCEPAGLAPLPLDQEELVKRLTGAVLTNGSFMTFDNVETLDGSVVPMLATSPSFELRPLGKSQLIVPENTLTFWITGNNPGTTTEILERLLMVRLERQKARPSEWRPDSGRFRFLSPEEEPLRDPAYLGAAVSLIRNWIDSGASVLYEQARTRFITWEGIVRGILQANGVSGFMLNDSRFVQYLNDEESQLTAFFGLWWRQWKDKAHHSH